MRVFLARLVAFLGMVLGGSLGGFIFDFGGGWPVRGVPIFLELWVRDPSTHLPLSVFLFIFTGSILVSSVAATRYWANFLRAEGLLDSRRPPYPHPIEKQTTPIGLKKARWIIMPVKLALFIWPLFVIAVAASVLIPLGLWLLAGSSSVYAIRNHFPFQPLVVPAVGGFFGVFTGSCFALKIVRRFFPDVEIGDVVDFR